MALLDRLKEVNHCEPNRKYLRLFTNDVAVGFVDTQLVPSLDSELFCVDQDNQRVDLRFQSNEREGFERRIEDFFKQFFVQRDLQGWRDEYYAVSPSYASEPLFLIERAILPFLGVTGYGIHVNGYVEQSDGLHMWVAKRAMDKPTSPGALDQIAAGGLPYGLSAEENVIKECAEEASIPKALAKQAKPVSAISYTCDLPIGMRPDVIFNYDLLLPSDFVPQVNDGEVASFTLYPMAELLELITNTSTFKFNSAVVVIDFAIRHGLLDANHPDYLALHQGMHARLCL